ncbi:MAG: oligosaccharide flippase family protein [Taibaiella sp.]|nr:oligosaccharide flippase family protein [Taibaiella sp.]
MKNKLLAHFFSSGLQAIAVQVLGAVFFYITSLYLDKSGFGIINWSNAVALFLTTLLSFGMEQVMVRRVAASTSSQWPAAAYFFHAIAGSVITSAILFTIGYIIKDNTEFKYLPWFFTAQAIMYIGSPLRQYLNAREKFTPYGIISVISNLLKILLVYMVVKTKVLTIPTVITILLICAALEVAALLFYVLRKTAFTFRFKLIAYKKLVKESLPQFAAVIFDTSLSRMDWILLGLISTAAATADYSFAYKAYEIARLPVIIIAPVILPRFARLLAYENRIDAAKTLFVNQVFAIQMFVAACIPLCMNIVWASWVGTLTQGKYGASNSLQLLILSLCVPLQFIINLLWTLCFSRRMYKAVLYNTIASAIINLVLNLILIPKYGGTGAAIAYLASNIAQVIVYFLISRQKILQFSLTPLVTFSALSIGAYYAGRYLTHTILMHLTVSLCIYVLLSVLLRFINKKHLVVLRTFLR